MSQKAWQVYDLNTHPKLHGRELPADFDLRLSIADCSFTVMSITVPFTLFIRPVGLGNQVAIDMCVRLEQGKTTMWVADKTPHMDLVKELQLNGNSIYNTVARHVRAMIANIITPILEQETK